LTSPISTAISMGETTFRMGFTDTSLCVAVTFRGRRNRCFHILAVGFEVGAFLETVGLKLPC